MTRVNAVAVPLIGLMICGAVTACGSPRWPESTGPMADTWGRAGAEDYCQVVTGKTFKGSFGGHALHNESTDTYLLTKVDLPEDAIAKISLLGYYGQWWTDGSKVNYPITFWDDWPPVEQPAEVPVPVELDLPVEIPPGQALNPMVGFEAETTADVHIPYLIYHYEVDGRSFQMIDPSGVRLVHQEATCDVMPQIFTREEEG